MRSSYRTRSAGMAELLKSDGVRELVTTRAESVLRAAVASAPVASGEYRESLEIVQATTDRAVARVITTAPHGMIVEANTGNLARALGSA